VGQYTCSLTTLPTGRGEDEMEHLDSFFMAAALKELTKSVAITFSFLHISSLSFKSQIIY